MKSFAVITVLSMFNRSLNHCVGMVALSASGIALNSRKDFISTFKSFRPGDRVRLLVQVSKESKETKQFVLYVDSSELAFYEILMLRRIAGGDVLYDSFSTEAFVSNSLHSSHCCSLRKRVVCCCGVSGLMTPPLLMISPRRWHKLGQRILGRS